MFCVICLFVEWKTPGLDKVKKLTILKEACWLLCRACAVHVYVRRTGSEHFRGGLDSVYSLILVNESGYAQLFLSSQNEGRRSSHRERGALQFDRQRIWDGLARWSGAWVRDKGVFEYQVLKSQTASSSSSSVDANSVAFACRCTTS